MAYNASNEERISICLVDKNDHGDKISVQKIKNKTSGAEFADVRLMYTPEGTDELRGTKKGIRMRMDLLPKVVSGMTQMLSVDEMEKLKDELTARIAEAKTDAEVKTEEA